MHIIRKKVNEEAPVNAAGAGNIAGIGIGSKGEPSASKSHILRRGKFAGHDTFIVPSKTYHQARGFSKKDRAWWKKYIEEEDGINEIREFANKNPKKPVIFQDEYTGAMFFARYGKKQ